MNRRLITVVITIVGNAMILLTDCISQCKPVAVDPCASSNKVHAAVTPIPPQYDYWFANHNAIVERNKQARVDLIFIGNSITKRWDPQIWNEYYAPFNAVNMGFDGDGTQNVLWRLDNGEIDGISPKLAVILIRQCSCKRLHDRRNCRRYKSRLLQNTDETS